MFENKHLTIGELYAALDLIIPSSLSCEWDNDGLSVCPDKTREVHRILLSLDPDENAVDIAVREGYDCIISHHPLLFNGLKEISGSDTSSRKVITLLANNVSAMSFHTRLDALNGGVNDTLCELFGLTDISPFGQNGEAIGRIGTLPSPLDFEDFVRLVKTRLGSPVIITSACEKRAYRIAVLGGSGSDDVDAARAAGADTYVTGELKYHQLCDAPYSSMNLIAAGHYYTEFPVLIKLENILKEIFLKNNMPLPEIRTVSSCNVKII